MNPAAGQIWKLDGYTILLYRTSPRGWLRSMAIYDKSPMTGNYLFGRDVIGLKSWQLKTELVSSGKYLANLEYCIAILDDKKPTTTA